MPKGPSKSTVIIQQLLEERRQYEAWIARLNDSADATPGHVRARVRSDYEARLAAVTEELKAHAESARQAIEEKRYLRGELQKKEARAAEKLAFIKSVTEDDQSAPSARRASGAQFQPSIPGDPPRTPMRAANPVPAPIVPEPTEGDIDEEAAKTLRCKECGTMNLATEWYCAQCGAELAAV